MKGSPVRVRASAFFLLDLTNRRGPTGFSDFYLPELSGPENRPAVTRFVMDCMSDRRGQCPGRRGPDKRLNGYGFRAIRRAFARTILRLDVVDVRLA
jgi:hypothetical protein